ncbi:hypothetical protein ACHAWF_001988 [Thalassiosira exigua]
MGQPPASRRVVREASPRRRRRPAPLGTGALGARRAAPGADAGVGDAMRGRFDAVPRGVLHRGLRGGAASILGRGRTLHRAGVGDPPRSR